MNFALVGNQNSGKTTLFNQLTGANQHVGNFPGVTVESKTGILKYNKNCSIVDLPGIYSLRPYTEEEIIARDYVIDNKPDVIINIIDATNIERNLYLTLQLLELNIPLVIALNMMDEIKNNGGSVNIKLLSELLGVPVVPISAAKKEGIEELTTKIIETGKNKIKPKIYDFCDKGPVHRCIHAVSHLIEDHAENIGVSYRFAATKIIEGDELILGKLNLNKNETDMIEHSIVEMETEKGLDRNAALAEMRYIFIEKVCSKSVTKKSESLEYIRSKKIDSVLTHKYLAIPVFISIVLLMFYLTFGVIGQTLSDLLGLGIDFLALKTEELLVLYGVNPVVQSLVVDGVFAGVGSVLSFLPLIIVLFFFLSVLEDTGYMARVAFVMDKPLRKIGLSGKSFVPMLVGFGCTVPAIMSSRTLSSERDRKMTVLLTPFASCSAKVPIYSVFAAAFFPNNSALVMISLYLFGLIVGVIFSAVLNKTVYKGKSIPFVMELPNYRFPSFKSVFLLMYEKAKDFVQRAFGIIFVATVVIWFLQSFDVRLNVVSDSSLSILAQIGKLISPVFAPLGFGDWRMTTALISGLSAKEAVVSTLSVLFNTTFADLSGILSSFLTPVKAISFLVFTLLYTPCIAAIATIKREFNSSLKAIFIVLIQCLIAWIFAFITYNVANILF